MATGRPVYVFQIRGQFAHWRKWFTTTSALTYAFPPRTAVIGVVGAILGVSREKVAEIFSATETRIAVQPLKPIEKDRLPQKWRQTPPRITGGKFEPAKMDESFQADLEVIRRPQYRIIFGHKNEELMTKLAERLKEKRWVYPPYMGIMGFLADVEWEAEDTADEVEVDQSKICTILPLTEAMALRVDLSGSEAYLREERIPNEVLPDRTFRHLYLAYVSRKAGPLLARAKSGKLPAFVLKQKRWQGVFFEQCTER